MAFFQVKKHVGKGRERENIKIIVPFRSNLTRNRKLKKKQQKNRKYSYVFFSSQNRFEKDEKMRK